MACHTRQLGEGDVLRARDAANGLALYPKCANRCIDDMSYRDPQKPNQLFDGP